MESIPQERLAIVKKSANFNCFNIHQQFRAFRKKQLGSLGVLFGVQNALSLYYQELL